MLINTTVKFDWRGKFRFERRRRVRRIQMNHLWCSLGTRISNIMMIMKRGVPFVCSELICVNAGSTRQPDRRHCFSLCVRPPFHCRLLAPLGLIPLAVPCLDRFPNKVLITAMIQLLLPLPVMIFQRRVSFLSRPFPCNCTLSSSFVISFHTLF